MNRVRSHSEQERNIPVLADLPAHCERLGEGILVVFWHQLRVDRLIAFHNRWQCEMLLHAAPGAIPRLRLTPVRLLRASAFFGQRIRISRPTTLPSLRQSARIPYVGHTQGVPHAMLHRLQGKGFATDEAVVAISIPAKRRDTLGVPQEMTAVTYACASIHPASRGFCQLMSRPHSKK